MNFKSFRSLLIAFFCCCSCVELVCQTQIGNEWETLLTMREIGHELLMSWGDDSTRVLPVVNEQNTYLIRFEPRLNVEPKGLVTTINEIADRKRFAKEYLVEVISCDSQKLEYSYYYLVDSLSNDTVIPCMERPLPVGCYELKISILDKFTSSIDIIKGKPRKLKTTASFFERNNRLIWIFVATILILAFWFSQNRRKDKLYNSGSLLLGSIQFDTKNMLLVVGDQTVELTSKESDLLHILYKHANETVERDTLLHKVWGDGGGYVGRTLDVFVSKLRKKLEADPKIKLVNVRGVGYKLILND